MFKRTIAASLLFVSLLAPTSLASGRECQDQLPLQERIIRFLRAHIPPMFVAKPADDPVAPHP